MIHVHLKRIYAVIVCLLLTGWSSPGWAQESVKEKVLSLDWDQLPSWMHQAYTIGRSIWNLTLFTVYEQPVRISNIIVGLIVFLIGMWLSRKLTRLIYARFLARTPLNKNAAVSAKKLINYSLLVALVMFVMQIMNIPLTVFTLFGGAVAIAVGFGAQSLLNNFISGFILMVEQPIKVEDIVEIDGAHGYVEDIGARRTKIRLPTGIHMLVPNSFFLEQRVVNWTLTNHNLRVATQVGVAYGSPTETVAELLQQALDENPKVLKTPEPTILFKEFGDSALNFELLFWVQVRQVLDTRRIKSEIHFRIDALFREAGIVIAFPQRDLHIDTLKPLEVRLGEPSIDRNN